MTSITSAPVSIQTSAQAAPAPLPWLGEVTLIAHYLTRQGVLAAVAEQGFCCNNAGDGLCLGLV